MPWLQVQVGGVLLGLAFTVPWGWALAWPAWWLILRGFDGRGAWERAADGSLAGVWWGLIAVAPWLREVLRAHLGVSVLASAGMSFLVILVYGGAFVALFAALYGWLPRPRWLAAPALWVVLERVRTVTLGGLAWPLLGHSQHDWLRLAQIAELGGASSVSFLIVLAAGALAATGRERRIGVAVAAGALLAALGFGSLRLAQSGDAPADGATVQLVSGGHRSGDRLTTYVSATRALPAADLTVWPAGALGGEYVQDDARVYEALIATARRVGPLLVGASRHQDDGARRHFETAILIEPEQGLAGLHDRQGPFGARSLQALLRAGLTAAGIAEAAPLDVDGLHVGVLLRWEIMLPELARAYARRGAHVLVALTGTADGVAAPQRAVSTFRAIETRRWLLRASGSGTSRAFHPSGRAYRADRVRLPAQPPPATVWVRYGEVMPWASAVVLALLLGAAALRRRTAEPPAP